jgi:AraC family transcriptional regulator
MTSQDLIHPSDLLKPEWIQDKKSIAADGLMIRHDIESPDDIESHGTTHHFLASILRGTSRQVTRCEGQESDGETRRGDAWLIPAERSVHWSWESTDEALMFIVDPVFLSQIAAETNGVKSDRLELLTTVHVHDPKLLSLSLLFLEEMQSPQWGNQLYVESLANLFCIHLLRHYCSRQPQLRDYEKGLAPYQLNQVKEFIQAHLNEDVRLTDLASTVSMSRYYFIKLFKQSTGLTPYQYLMQQRIQRAKERLRQHRGIAIAEIALQCGFANQSHFTRLFRQMVGTTPRNYRGERSPL